MTIEQQLLDYTPLPLDIIRFCVEPYIIPDQAYWRQEFDHVIKSIKKYNIHITYLSLIYSVGRKSFDFIETCPDGYKFKYVFRSSLAQTVKDARASHTQYIVIMRQRPYRYGLCWDVERFEQISPPKPSLISRIKSWFCKFTS